MKKFWSSKEKIQNSIMDIREKEQKHYWEYREKKIQQVYKFKNRSLLFGFLLGFFGLLGGFILVLLNKNLLGSGILFTSIATIIGTSIYAIKIKRNQN